MHDHQNSFSQRWVVPVVATVVPLAFLLACSAAVVLLLRRQKQKHNSDDSEDEQYVAAADHLEKGVVGPRRYSYLALAAATGNFTEENRLGCGGFGPVYRGRLKQLGSPEKHLDVAVKVLTPESASTQGRKQFEAEVRIISQLRHHNLVQLVGWCDSPKRGLLVYELVLEGSLHKHL